MSIEYKVIGRHIRTARKRKNMTQEDVAAAIEMSPAHFGKVERGDRPVNLQRLSQLSQVLDVPLEKLVEGAAIADDSSTVSKTGFTGNTDFIDSIWNCCAETMPSPWEEQGTRKSTLCATSGEKSSTCRLRICSLRRRPWCESLGHMTASGTTSPNMWFRWMPLI